MDLLQYFQTPLQVVQQNLNLLNTLSIFLLFSVALLILKRSTKNSKLNLPPSPPKLPLLGNLHQLGSLPHLTLRALTKKYGPVMLVYLGQTPTLIVSSAKMVKEMTKDNDIAFSNRPHTTAARFYLYDCIDLAFLPYGDEWRNVRKACVVELLSVKRVKSFQYVRDQEVAASVDIISHSCRSNGGSVNMSEILLNLSNHIISRCTLGQKYDGEDNNKNFGKLSRKVFDDFVAFSVGDCFPSLGWVDHVTGLIPRFKRTFKEFNSFFDEVIDEHRATLNEDKPEKDFVHLFLELQRDKLLGFDLTQAKIKATLMDMFVGGTATTATVTEWTMTELIKNPDKMKKAQDEVRKIVGAKTRIEESDINQMAYLKCVIKESLRLHPPLALLAPRQTWTTGSVKLGGYDIPPKTNVLINGWAIHRDPNQWDMPEEFVPERFMEKNAVDFRGLDFQYVPFGMGRKGCPGLSFGVASTESTIANMLYWFDWALPNGTTLENFDMSEAYGLTVHKKSPLHLVPAMYCP